ncbi:PREDICTED: uncharacterized protein LOC109183148 [Ipomoea nil]|uniref:uncharacterized protein LOC109183148 n=1 Tax=Ipomoea nil TaxID=35883 RepID=UPI000900E2F8|nr:PREDICTED: uncharacterized protein LOC109183148 [Ipomoea nil]
MAVQLQFSYVWPEFSPDRQLIAAKRRGDDKSKIHIDVIADIKEVINRNNVLVKSFRNARSEIEANPRVEIKMRLIGKRSKDAKTYNLPTASEVAALIVGDLNPSIGERDILVEAKSGALKRISELNPAYLPLQYPILFPYREDIPFAGTSSSKKFSRHRISLREYFPFRIHERTSEISTILYGRRLFQQFLVDAYTMVESGRLIFVRTNQKTLRCEAYKGLSNTLTRGEIDPSTQGKRIILPSSFTGEARYMIQNYQDAMTICRWIGYPNLFVTFTCNPKLLEIQGYVNKRNLRAKDRPDIVYRIFKMKFDCLIKDFKAGKIFGAIRAVIYTIEFQKRGGVFLLFPDRSELTSSHDYMDIIISAEIPNKDHDKEYYDVVGEFMIHGPCRSARKNSSCMVDGIEGVQSTSQRSLLTAPVWRMMGTRAHMNVEWCNQSRSIKYLFKYVNKDNDRVTAKFYKSTVDLEGNEVIDEINMYYDCRCVSACEATWRLLTFDVQYRTPSVERLSFHLPDCQSVVFRDDDSITDVINRFTIGQSSFLGWFDANRKYEDARVFTYIEMPNKFFVAVHLSKTFVHLMGLSILHLEMHAARGLLDEDKEYIGAIQEASYWSSAQSMRQLFVTLLITNSLNRPEHVWNEVWHHLAEDAQFNQRRLLLNQDLVLNDDEKKNFALIELEKVLQVHNRSLKDFPPMPLPNFESPILCGNRLLLEELSDDRATLAEESVNLSSVGADIKQLEDFAKWIAAIGDGTIGGQNDGSVEVDIPPDMLLSTNGDPIATIIENTFPMFTSDKGDNRVFGSLPASQTLHGGSDDLEGPGDVQRSFDATQLDDRKPPDSSGVSALQAAGLRSLAPEGMVAMASEGS